MGDMTKSMLLPCTFLSSLATHLHNIIRIHNTVVFSKTTIIILKIPHNQVECEEYFCETMSVPHNSDMDMNNVM
jgi:hypothetical protein